MTTNNLREANNEVVVEGTLQEVRLDAKTTKDGRGYISGEIDIEVSEGSVHTFRLFSMQLKKDGKESGVYKGLNTVREEYLSVAKVGKEAADKVRITAGKLGINDYLGGDGQVKSYPQLSTNFINRVPANDVFEPKAEFEVELFIQSVVEEIKDEEETGRVLVKGYVPQYNGGIAPLQFVAEGEGADYIRDTYDTGHTVTIYGEIINKVDITRTMQEVGFGKPKEKIKRKFTREYLITGGSEPYDEDNVNAYSAETITKALTERQVQLDGLKEEKSSSTPTPKEEKKGFGSKPAEKKKPTVSKDELPF